MKPSCSIHCEAQVQFGRNLLKSGNYWAVVHSLDEAADVVDSAFGR